MSLILNNRRILLLHGLTKSPKIFQNLLKELDPLNYYVLNPTLSGHRDNPPYENEVRKINFTEELSEYVRLVSLDGRSKFDLVGSSFGALLGLIVLKQYPQLVNRFVFLSPPIHFREKSARYSLGVLRVLPELITGRLGSLPKNLVTKSSYKSSERYNVNLLSVLAKLRREILSAPIEASSKGLLIQSTYDHHLSPSSLYYLKNKLENCDIKIIAQDWGSLHELLEEQVVLKEIKLFLS